MLPRPSLYLRRLAPPAPRSPWVCRACLRRAVYPQRVETQTASFHATPRRFSEGIPNHYETLQLSNTASASEIKRQFYTLSKKYHPDRNPNDPTASTRFVAISEAYHILSVPERKSQYDAQLHHAQAQSRWGRAGGAHPEGSYSSASFGARPASGLNKRRTTFRGPPPSFYKSGGYGNQSAKREQYAYQSAPSGEGQKEADQESYGDFGKGFGPGQQSHGYQVPHFNDRRHKETHDNLNDHINTRRARARRTIRIEEEYKKGDVIVNFILVSSVLVIAGMFLRVFGDPDEHTKRKESASK